MLKRLTVLFLTSFRVGEFIERDYPIPQELLKGKSTVTVRFEPEKGHTAGPGFGVLIFRSSPR